MPRNLTCEVQINNNNAKYIEKRVEKKKKNIIKFFNDFVSHESLESLNKTVLL